MEDELVLLARFISVDMQRTSLRDLEHSSSPGASTFTHPVIPISSSSVRKSTRVDAHTYERSLSLLVACVRVRRL